MRQQSPHGASPFLWGAQTALAVEHFAIGTQRMPIELLHALALVKGAAAAANARLGRLDGTLAQAIAAAADEVAAGQHDEQFPLSVFQSGSGTQSHMNLNEVLARLAGDRLGRPVHPNDDVNRGQSSNDTVPAALHVALALGWRGRAAPALHTLQRTLATLSARHARVVKLGRTHLQDAVPLTVGQEVGGWLAQVTLAHGAIEAALPALHALPLGGTAVGTGLNTHPDFAREACAGLAVRTAAPFVPAADRFGALGGAEAVVAFHGALKTLAVALVKMANDIRWLASGPHGGLGELKLPANEPGSSIMPGKVNPTQCEALVMVGLQVMGHDATIAMAAAGGWLQLNTARPLIARDALDSLRLLADAMASFEAHALRGLALDEARIDALLQASLMSATALAPFIGYDRAAAIVRRAQREGLALRDAALADGIAPADFDCWTDASHLLGPS